MIFKIKYCELGGHTHFSIFAGKTPFGLGNCGTLAMRNEEFVEFKKLLQHDETAVFPRHNDSENEVRFEEIEEGGL